MIEIFLKDLKYLVMLQLPIDHFVFILFINCQF